LKKTKELLATDNSNPAIETKKKIDQRLEKIKSLSTINKEKQRSILSAEDKEKLLEALKSVIVNLTSKTNELKTLIENPQNKKQKGKAQNKNEKFEKQIDNVNYHLGRLEKIQKIFSTDVTVNQEELFKEAQKLLVVFMSNYEAGQPNPPLDLMYDALDSTENSFLNSTALSNSSSFRMDEDEIISTQGATKELTNEIITGLGDKDGADAENKINMSKIRANNFDHERRKMPKITDMREKRGEFNFFSMFETSHKNIARDTDTLPIAATKEKIPTKTVLPKRKIVDESLFEKFDIDTLFFIFYFQKGTYEQFLAAKELKKRTWRYHKKYCTWFKRLEAPRVTKEDYEQGTYAFFDYDAGGWCQRKKADFLFKYSYLEDD